MEKYLDGRFHVLAQFSFIISESELDYYHQKMNGQISE